MSKQDIEIKLIKIGKNKTWLLKELQENGFKGMYQSEFSSILSGGRTGPKAKSVLETIPLILEKEIEKQGMIRHKN